MSSFCPPIYLLTKSLVPMAVMWVIVSQEKAITALARQMHTCKWDQSVTTDRVLIAHMVPMHDNPSPVVHNERLNGLQYICSSQTSITVLRKRKK